MKKHIKNQDGNCMKEEYLIPTISNGKFFCFLGCRIVFDTKYGILKHYIDRHYHDGDRESLRRWGLSYDSLEL